MPVGPAARIELIGVGSGLPAVDLWISVSGREPDVEDAARGDVEIAETNVLEDEERLGGEWRPVAQYLFDDSSRGFGIVNHASGEGLVRVLSPGSWQHSSGRCSGDTAAVR
jgi:hypothetical protein